MKTFNKDYGVLTCPHIFRNERPVLLVVRDPDGYWQFMCGKDDAEDRATWRESKNSVRGCAITTTQWRVTSTKPWKENFTCCR